MNKEQYVQLRNSNGLFSIAYEFYKEKRTKLGKEVLPYVSFEMFLTLYPHKDECIDRAVQYYDHKFVVSLVQDPRGQTIKVL
jgi:hypothetical protein